MSSEGSEGLKGVGLLVSLGFQTLEGSVGLSRFCWISAVFLLVFASKDPSPDQKHVGAPARGAAW